MSTYAQSIQFLLSQVRRAAGSLEDGTVTAYAAGTTNLKTIWLDRGKQTEAANPYTLDANGTAALFGDGLYRFVIKSSSGTTVYDRDYVSIKEVTGIAYDVSDYASLAAAVAAIGSTPATLQFSTDQTLASNLTIPSTLELMPLNGAGIVTTGYTLTVNSSTARYPGWQIFKGTGVVKFSVSAGDTVYARWFGATGDYLTNPSNDDSTAILRTLASVTRANGSDYFRASTVKLSGLSRSTQRILVPYGVGIAGDAPGNTGLFFDTNTSTDGLVFDAALSNGGSFLAGNFVRDIQIASVSATSSRDLIVCNGVSAFRFNNVNVQGAGRYNILVQDGVDVRGYNVRSVAAKTNGLRITTAGSSVDTTTSFTNSYFIDTTHGYGAYAAGIGISFNDCYFEHNGVTDTLGGGIEIGSGTVTLNAPYFENNAGHNIYMGSDTTPATASGNFTVINPMMVKNPTQVTPHYGLYINAGANINLIGGDYSINSNTIYINRANVGVINNIGAISYPSSPVLSSGTLSDLSGIWQMSDGTYRGRGVEPSVGASINSAATISLPSYMTTILNATTPITTISVPYAGFKGARVIIPAAAVQFNTGGNISKAVTCVIGRALTLHYDGTTWYPDF